VPHSIENQFITHTACGDISIYHRFPKRWDGNSSLPNSLIDIKDEANSAIKYVDMARCRSAPATKSPTKRATEGRRGKAAEPWYRWILIASAMFAAVGW
jgi:hypothetical protein